ncbi:MAG: carbohydrate ABC transporter permease [Candidatus Coatesbacteria bacterium]|nr:carbohydrate ABC transporter permease [Candidatus Coatesbacteria bacterium]
MHKKLLIHLILIIFGITMMTPFIWMLLTSFKSPQEAISQDFHLLPDKIDLSNYIKAWKKVPFTIYFENTIIMTLFVTLIVLMTSSLAAFIFAWADFKGKDVIFYFLLSMMMVPMPVFLIPNYIILDKLNWLDTFYALIVPWSINIFSIFLLRQHFKTIPKDLIEAAVIDGCTPLKILWHVVIPLSKPSLVTVGIFNIIGTWNSFMWPLVVTNSDDMRVIQVGLSFFNQGEGTQWTLQMAAATFTIIPVLIIYFIAQRGIMANFARSGIKG